MENNPFQSTNSLQRSPPLTRSLEDINQSDQNNNLEHSENQPIASRTRSKSIDIRSQLELEDSIDLTTPPPDPIANLLEEQQFTKELVIKLQRLPNSILGNETPINPLEFIMANLSYTDLINAIPTYDGNERELESFINSCDIYYNYLSEDQRGLFLAIAISKLKGEALSKLQPTSAIRSWDEMKSRLEQRIRRPFSFEYAQEKLVRITQSKNENIESYGRRVKDALGRLNSATRTLTNDENAYRLLKEANEKLAIRKFEQNILNPNIKIIVSAANKTSLESSLAFAMEKELSVRYSISKTCNYCKKEGHYERDCMSKNRKSYSNFNKRDNYNDSNKNGFFNRNSNYKKPQNLPENKKGNENQNKNVRLCKDETLNLSDLFEENKDSKN